MTDVTFTDVTKTYADVDAVEGLNLHVHDGEFLVVVGPSGCGKSTTLRLIAGLETVSSGTIQMGERDVTDCEPSDRQVAMVFQNYALYPHMTARRNITFGMQSTGDFTDAEIERRVAEAAETLDIADLLDRKPKALSGGERQRVALGRALVRDPDVFLMDEPLSNLDAKLRIRMRAELAKLHEEFATTTVYVTHDQTEAMTLGDRVVVMNDGEVQQVATPQTLYDYPTNQFVAEFIGDPAMNTLPVELDVTGDDAVAVHECFRLPLPTSADFDSLTAGHHTLGVRPEHVAVATNRPHAFDATVTVTEPLGDGLLLECRAGSDTFKAHAPPRSDIASGDTVSLAFDTDRLHLFDPETSETVYHSDPDATTRDDGRTARAPGT